MNDPVLARYLDGSYLMDNPEWDIPDSKWKAEIVHNILKDNKISFKNLVEVGCGAGHILKELSSNYNEREVNFAGFDIATGLDEFWKNISSRNISFHSNDFFDSNKDFFDVALVLDVIEHVADPHNFLIKLKKHADLVVLHIPLDLSVSSVLREKPLLFVRKKVGHIHYFTKNLALMLLEECDYKIIDVKYTGAGLRKNQSVSLKQFLFGSFRNFFKWLLGDVGVRIFGGDTLIVLARAK